METLHFEFLNREQLPLIIQPRSSNQANINYLTQFLKEENTLFKERLLCYGAILLRGFNIHSAEQFSQIMDNCQLGMPFAKLVGSNADCGTWMDIFQTNNRVDLVPLVMVNPYQNQKRNRCVLPFKKTPSQRLGSKETL